MIVFMLILLFFVVLLFFRFCFIFSSFFLLFCFQFFLCCCFLFALIALCVFFLFRMASGYLHLLFMPLFFFHSHPSPTHSPPPLTTHVQAKDSTLNSIIHGACSEICMFYMPFRLPFCLLLSDVVASAIAVVVIICCGLFKDSMLAAL